MTQTVNLLVSLATAIAVVAALGRDINAVRASSRSGRSWPGFSQLVTAVRRWRSYGAQWTMILSGGQSALVGAVFAKQAAGPATPDITAHAHMDRRALQRRQYSGQAGLPHPVGQM